MAINIVENELPIKKNKIGECVNCKTKTFVREVETYSFIGGYSRGYYPFCFRCSAPVFRWRDGRLKDSRIWETPYKREDYMAELEAAERELAGGSRTEMGS